LNSSGILAELGCSLFKVGVGVMIIVHCSDMLTFNLFGHYWFLLIGFSARHLHLIYIRGEAEELEATGLWGVKRGV
jgi:hypothetical protein